MKKYIWIMMIALALLVGDLDFFVFEVIIYLCINGLIKFKKPKSVKKGYKYEQESEEQIQKENNELDSEYVSQMVEQARNEIEKRKERVASYDFREFRGRKNVDWHDVYEYLWYHCRYKGIPMWTEYMNVLIEEGVITDIDKKMVFKKAGKYISWKPRPDLEKKDEIDRNKYIKDDDYWDMFFEKVNKYNYEMYLRGDISKREYELYKVNTEHDDKYLKMFYYDEYLKRKGFI